MRVSEEWWQKKFGNLPERGKVFRPPEKKKANKYGAQKSGGYDSKHEHNRATELKYLQKAGEIRNLREQVEYELIPSQKGLDGKVVERAVKYIADFVYTDRNGNQVVEDAKGQRTAVYIIKRKLMLQVHGIRVVEI